MDVREEYTNAFRTESYNNFWARVVALLYRDYATCTPTTAARLPSYRLFAEHLLDPDQQMVTRILKLAKIQPATRPLLSDYFSETSNASLLCGSLLKDIDRTRVKYRSLQKTIQSLEISTELPENHISGLMTQLTEFLNSKHPFASTAPSPCRVQIIQARCSNLLKRLESKRDKIQAKFRLMNSLKHGSGLFVIALAASVTAIVATHALAVLVAGPGFLVASLELASVKKLARSSAQLDAAAKGTYILNRDLDIISRLAARLDDELERMRTMGRFWLQKMDDRLQASYEMARQLKKSDASFSQQLDELEELLYLCFMTINRARNLVVKQILDPGRPKCYFQIISK